MIGARLGACWTAGSPGIDAEARRWVDVLAALSAASEPLARWVFHDARELTSPCTVESVGAALRAATMEEKARAQGLVRSHRMVCRAQGRFEPVAELRVTIIADHQGTREAWVPSRVLLELHGETPLGTIRRMLDVLVRATDPAWAFADCGGGAWAPDPEGTPRVGWATYVHRIYGRPRTRVDGLEIVPRGNGRMVQPTQDHPDDLETLVGYAEAAAHALALDGVLRTHEAAVREPGDFEPDELAHREVAAPRPASPQASRGPAAVDPPPASPPAQVTSPPIDAILETQAVRPSAPGPTLPFVHRPGAAEAFAPPEVRQVPPRERSSPDPLGETAVPETMSPFASPGDERSVLPFGARADAPPAREVTPLLTLEQYASLCAWLAAEPHDRASLLARHHVASEGVLATIEADYRARFALDPALHGRFAGLVMRYREAFARFPRGGAGSGT